VAERLRDAGVGVVFVVQSYEGLGDEHQPAWLGWLTGIAHPRRIRP
jgi:hypothetical protein